MKPQPAKEPVQEGQSQTSCQAVSPMDEPCDETATAFCDNCERWFCAAHFENDEWHICGFEVGDEGGEG